MMHKSGQTSILPDRPGSSGGIFASDERNFSCSARKKRKMKIRRFKQAQKDYYTTRVAESAGLSETNRFQRPPPILSLPLISPTAKRLLPLPAEIPQQEYNQAHSATSDSDVNSQPCDKKLPEKQITDLTALGDHQQAGQKRNNINNNDGSELDTDDGLDPDRLPSVLLNQISKQSLEHMKQVGLFDEMRMNLINKLETSEKFSQLIDLFRKEVETFCKRTDMSQPRAKLRDQLNERSLNKSFSILRFQVDEMIRHHRHRICKLYEQEASRFFQEMKTRSASEATFVATEAPESRVSSDLCNVASEMLSEVTSQDPSPTSSSRSLDSGLALSSSPSTPLPISQQQQQRQLQNRNTKHQFKDTHNQEVQQQQLEAPPLDQIPMPPSPPPPQQSAFK